MKHAKRNEKFQISMNPKILYMLVYTYPEDGANFTGQYLSKDDTNQDYFLENEDWLPEGYGIKIWPNGQCYEGGFHMGI